ncbi:MAG: hypothetical protein WDZ41_05680 [Candidatus Babeliales bacterium]
MKFKLQYLSLLSIFFICTPNLLLGYEYHFHNQTGYKIQAQAKVRRGLGREKTYGPIFMEPDERKTLKHPRSGLAGSCLKKAYAQIISGPYAKSGSVDDYSSESTSNPCGNKNVYVKLDSKKKKAKLEVKQA